MLSFLGLFLLITLGSAARVPAVFRREGCNADQCFNAVQSAASASSDCSVMMDPVTTATHPETFLTGVEVQTTYSTSPVTVFALATGTSDSSASAKAKRQAEDSATPSLPSYASGACNGTAQYASVCSCMGITESTYTYPLFTAVATSTTTETFSEVARATHTAAACESSNNYGYFNGTLDVNVDGNGVGFPIGEPRAQTFSNMTAAQCCSACFTSPDGCISYAYSANSTCSLSLYDGGCPSGYGGLEVIAYSNDEKPAIGVGPCDVEVQSFIDG